MNTGRRHLALFIVLPALGGCAASAQRVEPPPRASADAEREALRRRVAELGESEGELLRDLVRTTLEKDVLAAQVDDARALAIALQDALEAAGRDLELGPGNHKRARAQLDALRESIRSIRGVENVIRGEARFAERLDHRLRAQIEKGQLQVSLQNGFVTILLDSDTLFARGTSNLLPNGSSIVEAVAGALGANAGRELTIRARADGDARLALGWHVSSEQATVLARRLIAGGVRPTEMTISSRSGVDAVDARAVERPTIELIIGWFDPPRPDGDPGVDDTDATPLVERSVTEPLRPAHVRRDARSGM